MSNSDEMHWSLDRRVPIAVILTIVLQTVGIVWWAAGINQRVEVLERRVDHMATQGDRIIRLEILLQGMREDISEMRTWVRPRSSTTPQ